LISVGMMHADNNKMLVFYYHVVSLIHVF